MTTSDKASGRLMMILGDGKSYNNWYKAAGDNQLTVQRKSFHATNGTRILRK